MPLGAFGLARIVSLAPVLVDGQTQQGDLFHLIRPAEGVLDAHERDRVATGAQVPDDGDNVLDGDHLSIPIAGNVPFRSVAWNSDLSIYDIDDDGVLNAPEYTRTCSCGYQNQTSLAMVYMPEVEMWTHSTLSAPGGPIKKVGVNFGAPGDRLADNGTFWLDYPSVGGSSPNISVSISPSPQYFRHHGGRFEGEQMGWVTASGAIGATSATVNMKPRWLMRAWKSRLKICR